MGLSLGFDVTAQIPQRLSGSPNYFGLLNNLMTLIICESLREIGEMAYYVSHLAGPLFDRLLIFPLVDRLLIFPLVRLPLEAILFHP